MKYFIIPVILFTSLVQAKSKPDNFSEVLLEDVSKDLEVNDYNYKRSRGPASAGGIELIPDTKAKRLEDQQKSLKSTEKLNQRQIGSKDW